jgi:hypothetical protein
VLFGSTQPITVTVMLRFECTRATHSVTCVASCCGDD